MADSQSLSISVCNFDFLTYSCHIQTIIVSLEETEENQPDR